MGEKINDDHSNSGDEYIRSKTTVLVEVPINLDLIDFLSG